MLNVDEDALVCDLAETYNIYNYKGLSLLKAATFSCGLRYDSRIKLKVADAKVSNDTLMIASILDQVNFIAWSKTDDATRGYGRPKRVVDVLMGKEEIRENESFVDADEFERMRRSLLEN